MAPVGGEGEAKVGSKGRTAATVRLLTQHMYTHHPALKNQDVGARRSSLTKSQALGQFFNPWWGLNEHAHPHATAPPGTAKCHSVTQRSAPQPCSHTHHSRDTTNCAKELAPAARRVAAEAAVAAVVLRGWRRRPVSRVQREPSHQRDPPQPPWVVL